MKDYSIVDTTGAIDFSIEPIKFTDDPVLYLDIPLKYVITNIKILNNQEKNDTKKESI